MDDYIENPNLARKIIFGDDRVGGSGYFVFTFFLNNLKTFLMKSTRRQRRHIVQIIF